MAKSPFYVERQRSLSRVDDLRERLTQLEAKLGVLGYGIERDETRSILDLFDAVSADLTEMEVQGQSVQAERARYESVSAEFRRKASLFLRAIGGAKALQELRRARQPDPDNWWWFVDRVRSDERRFRLRRWLRRGGIALGALLVLVVLYQLFLAPDLATRERIRHRLRAESLAEQGDWSGALAEVEQALAIAPHNYNLLLMQGVLQEQLGRDAAAEKAFAAAEESVADRETFLISRGDMYLSLVGQAEPALADAEAAVALNPESAEGHLLLATAAEMVGNYSRAIEGYQKAADLAEAQGKSDIVVIARYSLGLLLQRVPIEQQKLNE